MVCLLRADDVHFDLVFKLFSSSENLAAIPSSNEHQQSIDSSSIYSFYLSAIAINEKATCRIELRLSSIQTRDENRNSPDSEPIEFQQCSSNGIALN